MLIRLLNTIKYLKPIQLGYLVKHRVKKLLPAKSYNDHVTPLSVNLIWNKLIYLQPSYFDKSAFRFINLEKQFENNKIDWNYSDFGKLWTYNLNYFDYLNQQNLSHNAGLELIFNYIDNYETIVDGKEPAPTAIRTMNWVKFLSFFDFKDRSIDKILWEDTNRLKDNLEYHLLGNHLLEDGFGLLFASYYFRCDKIYLLSVSILEGQLEEQILEDGGHFELSSMYHQLILFRILDAINLIKNNNWKTDKLLNLLERKASIMLGWLLQMQFSNFELPLVNDSAKNVYPDLSTLVKYGKILGINAEVVKLKDSGYRKIENQKFECLLDIGNIGPNYQPGHAHADTFNFILNVGGKPFIVDTGCSTYQINNRRLYERSTEAHNTVVVDDTNSSEVWSGFRVAKRATVTIVKEVQNEITASHDGYKSLNAKHLRNWSWTEDSLTIIDNIYSNRNSLCKAYIHFDSQVKINRVTENEYNCDNVKFNFENTTSIIVEDFEYATEFNHLIKSKRLCISFYKFLTTNLNFK